jgi:SAM-dependent methyltransferase
MIDKEKTSPRDNHSGVSAESLPYQALAPIYNQVMKHVDYQHWAKYIASIIRKNCPTISRIFDVGCGTGEFIFHLTNLGFKVDGCDPSREMLEIARKRNPESNLQIDHMPELQTIPDGEYQVITCLYDTINYLPTMQNFSESVIKIYNLLPEKGLFIFDVVSEKMCQLYFHGVDEQEVIDKNFAYSRRSFFNRAVSQQVNEFSIYTPRGIFEEKHVQKIYSFKEIKQTILDYSKFNIVNVYEDFTFFPVEKGSNRAHFILKKA